MKRTKKERGRMKNERKKRKSEREKRKKTSWNHIMCGHNFQLVSLHLSLVSFFSLSKKKSAPIHLSKYDL